MTTVAMNGQRRQRTDVPRSTTAYVGLPETIVDQDAQELTVPSYGHGASRATEFERRVEGRWLPDRLREGKLLQWIAAYLALAWMALQMTDALREIWSWPIVLQRAITLALGLGILPAAVLAWFHGERGRQKVCLAEVAIMAVLLSAAGWVIWQLCG